MNKSIINDNLFLTSDPMCTIHDSAPQNSIWCFVNNNTPK